MRLADLLGEDMKARRAPNARARSAFAVFVTAVILSSCGASEELPPNTVSAGEAVAIFEASLAAPAKLVIAVGSCKAEPEVSILEQDSDAVRVKVVSTVPAHPDGSADCLDLLEVVLEDPLGDRVLVDLTSGKEVHVGESAGS